MAKKAKKETKEKKEGKERNVQREIENEAGNDDSDNGNVSAEVVYGCQCGFQTPDISKFRSHLLWSGRAEPGIHKSLGKIDSTTGQLIAPPYAERPHDPTARVIFGKKGQDGTSETTTQQTKEPAKAQAVRFVPRILVCDYTPIMRAAQEAASEFYGWDRNMPLEDFIDTILHAFFKDRGIILAGYYIEKEETVGS